MKREVMKKAWEMLRKGFNETFAVCLKAAWALVKKSFAVKTMTQDELNEMMRNNKQFRHAANGSNLSSNVIYQGAGVVTYSNARMWVKKGIARIYADKCIDGIKITETYLEVR